MVVWCVCGWGWGVGGGGREIQSLFSSRDSLYVNHHGPGTAGHRETYNAGHSET